MGFIEGVVCKFNHFIEYSVCAFLAYAVSYRAGNNNISILIHYAVDNIPSGFSCTASQTLSAATLPHALAIAEKGVEQALLDDKHLRRGLTTYKGKLCLLETALKHNLPFTDPKDAIEGK